jgi:N-acetylglucosamine-6-sulfatase
MARSVMAAVLITAAVVLASCASPGLPTSALLPSGPYSKKPNIVFVLTDDLDSSLVQYMPHVVALERDGMTFTNYTVTDSLCCPSRASIFTGKFPHDTKVYTNDPPDGGFGVFYKRGEDKHTFATALQAAGYRTALMGKYLNEYPVGNNAYNYPTDYVPPGWSTWDVVSNGYQEFNYNMNSNHSLVTYGGEDDDYLTYVLGNKAHGFIDTSAAARKPFFLEVATFSPHPPFTPAPKDRGTFAGVHAPRGPSFNRVPLHAPRWLRDRPRLSRKIVNRIDYAFQKRVAAVQSVDRMIGNLEGALRDAGQLRNTYFVFSSDNGFHLGQHGLARGKLTAFDTDIRVPLVIAGPGIPPESVNRDVTENIDVAPTFEQLGGASVPATVDGHSLVPLLGGQNPPWRTLALVEHHGPDTYPGDPDAQSYIDGNPPTYEAIRNPKFTYVKYDNGEREYYNLANDPAEMDNIYGSLSSARVSQLDKMLAALRQCHGAISCWAAGRPGNPAAP